MSLFSFSNTKKGLTTDFTVGEMGGKIPRQIKEKVIRQWLQGTRRSTIAKDNGIGEGTVTNIIKDASLQEEYHDMELFRQLALLLNEKGLEPVVVFSIRLLKKMEDDGVNLSQVEPIDPTLPPTASNTRYPLPRLFKVDTKHFR